jgi:nicotinate-nucleotide adenylyltransferase
MAAKTASPRVGILGGTFDPIHNGHLVIAEEVRVRLGLDRVLFIPARLSPLKMDEQPASGQHRCRMIELAIADNVHFALSRVDLDRPRPSYTVDTLRILQKELGEGTQIFFIMGQDALETLPHWRDPEEIVELAQLVVAQRPGYEPDVETLATKVPGLRPRLILLETPELSVSSTELRRRISTGWPIRYQVPDAVMRYIQQEYLYQDLKPTDKPGRSERLAHTHRAPDSHSCDHLS